MRTVITIFVLSAFPSFLLGQIAADTTFLLNDLADFEEFHWQIPVEISDNSIFYFLYTNKNYEKIEIIDESEKLLWNSEKSHEVLRVPKVLIEKAAGFRIKIYSNRGITEVDWNP